MFSDIKKLYDTMYDAKSKRNFLNRFMYSLTGDVHYVINMIQDNCSGIEGYNIGDYYADPNTEREQKLIVYGALFYGSDLTEIHKALGREDIYCFCDRDQRKQKEGYLGKKVISPEQLVKEYRDYKVIIASHLFYDEIYEYLMREKFPRENIVQRSNFGHQYFDYDFFRYTDQETFVDGGAYDCGTIKDFINKVGGKYNNVYAFEPDEDNYKKCQQIIKNENIERVKLIHTGLWSKDAELTFAFGQGSCSKVLEDQTGDRVLVRALDSVCDNDIITFIKMDIEGAELEALKGAQKTIVRCKPKMAICIYHKPEDVLDIQNFLLSLVPEYRFGIRHYTDILYETVLYAFIPE